MEELGVLKESMKDCCDKPEADSSTAYLQVGIPICLGKRQEKIESEISVPSDTKTTMTNTIGGISSFFKTIGDLKKPLSDEALTTYGIQLTGSSLAFPLLLQFLKNFVECSKVSPPPAVTEEMLTNKYGDRLSVLGLMSTITTSYHDWMSDLIRMTDVLLSQNKINTTQQQEIRDFAKLYEKGMTTMAKNADEFAGLDESMISTTNKVRDDAGVVIGKVAMSAAKCNAEGASFTV